MKRLWGFLGSLMIVSAAFSAPMDSHRFPDVVGVDIRQQGDNLSFSVTLSSVYDTPERYADAFRVLDEQGNQLGIRVLLHDHASEQPFTRSLLNVSVPETVKFVTLQGRDLINGWGGKTLTVALPER